MSRVTTPPPTTGNRRVDRLLACATAQSWHVVHKVVTYTNADPQPYWVLTPIPNPDGYSLTVTANPNHGCEVLADLPGSRDWEPITQRRALAMMTEAASEGDL
jgi:hypothetical protein